MHILENSLIAVVTKLEQAVRDGEVLCTENGLEPSFDGLLYSVHTGKGKYSGTNKADSKIVLVYTPSFLEFCQQIESLVYQGYIVDYGSPIDIYTQYEAQLVNAYQPKPKKKGV